jgi:hypothetical protein
LERKMPFSKEPSQLKPQVPRVPAVTGEIPAVLGSYDAAGKFRFNSERDRINWLRKGYRQGTNPEAFEKGTPLHPDVEAAYATGAVEAPHHVFQGPDGKFRGKNAATAEQPEVYEARMRAWDGKRFKDIDPHAEKHIGEDEALKVMNGEPQAQPHAQNAVFNGGPILIGGPSSGIILAAASDGKGSGGLGGAVAAAGAGPKPSLPLITNPPLQRRTAPQQALPLRWQPPIPGSGAPPAAQGIRAKPPFERTPQDLSAAGSQLGRSQPMGADPKSNPPGQMPGNRGAAEQDWSEAAQWEGWPLNAMPRPNHQRTPESIVGAILDNETQRAYEDEWAKLEKANPLEIAQDKEDVARMIGAQAASEYQAIKRGQVTDEEFDSFVEAARRKLKLPVTNWRGEKEDAERSAALDDAIRNGEVEVYDHALDVTDVADMLVNGNLPITDGRIGNEQTQRHIRILAEKIAAELTRCGANVSLVRSGNEERQVQPSQGGNLGSHWPDISIFFEVDGKKFTLDVNHASTYAQTGNLKPGEAKQIEGLYRNRWAQLQDNQSGERQGSVYAFPKKRRQMTEAEYFAKMDDFVKAIIDCKSPVKIKVVLQKRKSKMEPTIPANER